VIGCDANGASNCSFIAVERFKRSTDGLIVVRMRNPYGLGCSNGSAGAPPCTGSACEYGPNGFSAAYVEGGTSADNITYQSQGTGSNVVVTCLGTTGSGWAFPNVTGTFPKNEGCPANSGGSSDGFWDY
jgi:hypothetical protein